MVTLLDELPGDDERALARDAVIAGGGPAATAAVAASRLGVSTAFVGTVGDDEAGRFVVSSLEREGVDASRVRVVGGGTAVSSIWVDPATGSRRIAAFYRAAGVAALTPEEIELAREAAWIHLDSPGFGAARLLREAGVDTPISLDAGNPIPNLDLSLVDLYAPTERRLLERHGATVTEAIDTVLASGPSIVVATRGGAGCVGARREPDDGAPIATDEDGFAVPVVSTLGAGDVFHGALLAGLVRDLDLRGALRLANAAAALSCRALDGRSAIPTWDEALAFAAAAGRAIEAPTPGARM